MSSTGEGELRGNLMKLREISAHNVMCPRRYCRYPARFTLPDLVAKMAKESHSRLPVYRESLDDIIGFVHIKDVLPFWGAEKPSSSRHLAPRPVRRAVDAGSRSPAADARRPHPHGAVVDEYAVSMGCDDRRRGREIVGEIETSMMSTKAEAGARAKTIVADARLPVEEFEEHSAKFSPGRTRSRLNTLGGFVVSLAGRVPGRGEIIAHPAGVEFEFERRVARQSPAGTPSSSQTNPVKRR